LYPNDFRVVSQAQKKHAKSEKFSTK
jgi:hypothetical protein